MFNAFSNLMNHVGIFGSGKHSLFMCLHMYVQIYMQTYVVTVIYIARSQLDVANFLHGDSVRYEKQSKALQSMIFLHKVCPLAQR